MPRLTPDDIPHTASTDHRILRRPAPLPNGENAGAEISAWQDPPSQFRGRDLAVASLVVGGTHGLSSLRDTGVTLLEALPQREKENDPVVLSSLVSVRLQRREPQQAQEFARRLIQTQPDSGFASLNLALALQNSGDEAGAERQLLHTIDLDPSLQPAFVNLMSLYEKQGRESDRIAILDRYLRWNPQNIWARQLKAAASAASAPIFEELAAQASAARDANKISQAIELYRQALLLKPAWTEGWWFLGTLSYDSDQYESGRQAFAEFVKLDDKAAPGWSFLGLCEFETGEYAHALEHIRRGLEIGTGLEPAIEQVLRFHEALLLTRLGLFDQAWPRFMPFVRRGVQDPALIAGVGLTALRQPLLPKEVSAGEHDLIVAAGQTACLWMAGDTSKTTPAFRALVNSYPTAPDVHYLYATYLLSFRPAEEAAAELKRELEVNPRSADARAMIALLMVRAGASSAALPYARQAAQDGPTSPTAQYTYGLILAGTGDLRQAIERLEAAERLDPANIDYHMGLASAYSKAGRHEDARRERRTSIELARESDSRGPG
jgi:tetratricopeptide (TPR) repeat protein